MFLKYWNNHTGLGICLAWIFPDIRLEFLLICINSIGFGSAAQWHGLSEWNHLRDSGWSCSWMPVWTLHSFSVPPGESLHSSTISERFQKVWCRKHQFESITRLQPSDITHLYLSEALPKLTARSWNQPEDAVTELGCFVQLCLKLLGAGAATEKCSRFCTEPLALKWNDTGFSTAGNTGFVM